MNPNQRQTEREKTYDIYLTFPLQRSTRMLISEQFLIIPDMHVDTEIYDLIGVHEEQKDLQIYEVRINRFARRTKCIGAATREVSEIRFFLKMKSEEYYNFKQMLLKLITKREQLKRLMIYFNPNAGANSAKHLHAIMTFIRLTNFTYDLLETQAQGHCKSHLNGLNQQQYEAVVIVSGDGLMHEFVNSRMATLIPVTHVPAGSGNAFAKSQTALAEEDCRDEESIFLVVKGNTRSFNLVKIELEHYQEPIYSFLSLQWAFLADVDINSQFLRFLGGLRFEVFSFWRLISLKRYQGKITYSTSTTAIPPLSQPIDHPDYTVKQEQFLFLLFCFIPYISQKYHTAPLLKHQDEIIDMHAISSATGRWQLTKYLLNCEKGGQFDTETMQKKQGFRFDYAKLKSFRLEPNGANRGIYGIDGERYDSQRLQASMSERKVRAFA